MPDSPELLAAVNRAAVYGQVSRWLIHDLRNPSQALTLLTDLMHEEYEPNDESPEDTIREVTRHLIRSVELLDRVLRVPPHPAEPSPVSLREIMEFLGALHGAHRSAVALDLTSVLSQSLPAVAASEDHLEHALLNVLMNAIEACAGRQDGRIIVTATAAAGRVAVEVADNGPGVDEEMRRRLFEPFATTRPGRPHAGLGLAVARELLGRTGGTVNLDSRESGGTRFVVSLPAWR